MVLAVVINEFIASNIHFATWYVAFNLPTSISVVFFFFKSVFAERNLLASRPDGSAAHHFFPKSLCYAQVAFSHGKNMRYYTQLC